MSILVVLSDCALQTKKAIVGDFIQSEEGTVIVNKECYWVFLEITGKGFADYFF